MQQRKKLCKQLCPVSILWVWHRQPQFKLNKYYRKQAELGSLPTPLYEKWKKWINNLSNLQSIEIPRCHVGFSSAIRRELHVDASETVYAAAVYWRLTTSNGKICTSIAVVKPELLLSSSFQFHTLNVKPFCSVAGYYANLLAQAREAVVQKRRGKLSRGVLFLQDNASVHTARVSRQVLKNTGYSEIDHPPYSPDLAPSDYFLFSI
ncbi:Mariner Mos1 transposase [Eumeta japonica]|uniref:Mariner Mos1 transposase n=1 Tax=Eumeta variegata TaxID=151549 RepID=A0A4C1VMA5_EUMVA|nr:Mariner Mos1 transposase [Eumeta japonica]